MKRPSAAMLVLAATLSPAEAAEAPAGGPYVDDRSDAAAVVRPT